MRTLAEMTPDETQIYLRMMAELIGPLVPPDGVFALVVFDTQGEAHYVSTARREGIPPALRHLADAMEQQGEPG